MLGNVDIGHLRIIYVNDLPLIVKSTSTIYPTQEMDIIDLTQGGIRSHVYTKEKKTIQGNLSIPLYLNKNGEVAEACKKIISLADNPLNNFNLAMNFGVMGTERTALLYQKKWDTSLHRRLTFECAVINKLSLTIEKNSNVSLELSFIALPEKEDSLINDYDFEVPYENLMSRHCSFADCIITRLDDTVFLKDITNFSLEWENPMELIYLIPGSPEMSRDYANYIALSKSTKITGYWEELKRACDWSDELSKWNHGGYARGDIIKVRIADITGIIQDPLYKLEEQPLSVGILKKKTNFIATFRGAMIYENNPVNMIFPDLQ